MPYRFHFVFRLDIGYPDKYSGNTECVAFVRQTTGAPHHSEWKAGRRISDALDGEIPSGTAIATFDNDGKYPTDTLGKHAAIYVSHDDKYIYVYDQWNSQGK
ncbi:BPSL0067 family protein [Chryseolinea sp. T2]|uniref:BPSL0067 family protein n=1 Tax=Chryseolinea sp. T2 TaxID=3129255 RepID=UPI003076DABA